MNRKERLHAAFTLQEPDRTPVLGGWWAAPEQIMALTGASEDEYWADPFAAGLEAERRLGSDGVIGIFVPKNRGGYRHMDHETLERRAAYTLESAMAEIDAFPSPEQIVAEWDEEAAYAALMADWEASQARCGDILWCNADWGLVPTALWYQHFGYETYFTALALYPERVTRMIRASAERARLKSKLRARAIREGRHPLAILTGEDICTQRGSMVSPEFLRRVYYPLVEYALEPLVDVGCKLVWHCDGNWTTMLDDLLACGVGGLQGFQRECGMDLEWLVERRVHWRALASIAAGTALGLVVNPYFSRNGVFLYRHLMPKLLSATATSVGSEWYPYSTAQLLENSSLALAAFVVGALALGLAHRRMTVATATSFLVAALYRVLGALFPGVRRAGVVGARLGRRGGPSTPRRMGAGRAGGVGPRDTGGRAPLRAGGYLPRGAGQHQEVGAVRPVRRGQRLARAEHPGGRARVPDRLGRLSAPLFLQRHEHVPRRAGPNLPATPGPGPVRSLGRHHPGPGRAPRLFYRSARTRSPGRWGSRFVPRHSRWRSSGALHPSPMGGFGGRGALRLPGYARAPQKTATKSGRRQSGCPSGLGAAPADWGQACRTPHRPHFTRERRPTGRLFSPPRRSPSRPPRRPRPRRGTGRT